MFPLFYSLLVLLLYLVFAKGIGLKFEMLIPSNYHLDENDRNKKEERKEYNIVAGLCVGFQVKLQCNLLFFVWSCCRRGR